MADRPNCLGCGEPMSGKFLQAFDGYWHLNCFTCQDCGEIVASKFFPIDSKPYCEKDYFLRRNLICAKCNEPIKGQSIAINDKRWHPEHFTCTMCETVLHRSEKETQTYFENEGLPYCSVHYSIHFASPCFACKMAILDQFVEDQNKKWHLECYKLERIWGLQFKPRESYTPEKGLEFLEILQARVKVQTTTALAILWTFEEETAHAISQMVACFDQKNFSLCQKKAALVAKCAEEIFDAMDILYECSQKYNLPLTQEEQTRLTQFSDELCSSIDTSFVFVAQKASHEKERLLKKDIQNEKLQTEVDDKEFLNDAMDIAHAFKKLIGYTLNAALRLDRETPDDIFDLVLYQFQLPIEDFDITAYEPVKQFLNKKDQTIPKIHIEDQHNQENVQVRKRDKDHINQLTVRLKEKVRNSWTTHLSQFYEEEIPKDEEVQEDSDFEFEETKGTHEEEKVVLEETEEDPSSPSELPRPPRSLKEGSSPSSLDLDRANDRESKKNIKFLSELSALELLLAQQLAVVRLSVLLKQHYTVSELTSLIQTSKPTDLIRKILKMMKTRKKVDYACFGKPLYVAVEKTGVDSSFGSSHAKIKIPRVIEEGIKHIQEKGIHVQGIFRKAGLETRIQQLQEQFTKTSGPIDLNSCTPLDVAALLKRFLKLLPDPLLTFKLYDLFLISQKFSPQVQIEILHLICVLVPKCNRDLLEVLTTFLRRLSDHAQNDDNGGNFMTSSNLATVFAPTVLYSQKDLNESYRKGSKSLVKLRTSSSTSLSPSQSILDMSEGETANAISVVTILIDNSYLFSKVPDSIYEQLSTPSRLKSERK